MDTNHPRGKSGRDRVLEPIGQPDHTGAPTSYRLRRAEEPRPTQPSRLLYLPPVWSRVSFWLPVGLTEPKPAPCPDPHDDYAA